MRDYTYDYRNAVRKYLGEVKNSQNHDYRSPYSYQVVPGKYWYLKRDSIEVGRDACHHIQSIKDRVSNALTVINGFYDIVDATSTNTCLMANKIVDILDEVNSSLERINNSLNGIGEYAGKKVTPDDIRAAGIDESKCAKLKDKYFDYFMNNEDVVAAYIDEMKALQAESGTLPPEEMAKLNKMYDWYVINRYAPDGVTYMDRRRLKNCIDTYELINPDAKNTTDVFFEPAFDEDYCDETVELNVLCIKYELYTSDPTYRDLMLAYMKEMKLNPLPEKGVCCQSVEEIDGKKVCVLNIALHREHSQNCCSFFHEFGHGVDYLSGSGANTSAEFYDNLISDFKNTVTEYLNNRNQTLKPNEQLTDPEISEIVRYLLFDKNPNAVWQHGQDIKSALPDTWSDAQKKAYSELRDYYGYKEYVIGDPEIKYISATCPVIKGTRYNGIIKDIMGGITNDKICGMSGHGFQHYDENYMNYKNPDDLRDDLSSDKSGWYYKPGETTPAFLTEFFAEEFEYSVFNQDRSPTHAIFPTAEDAFEKKIQELSGDA